MSKQIKLSILGDSISTFANISNNSNKYNSITINEIKKHLLEVDGVIDVHHIHIRSIDTVNNYATVHIVTDEDSHIIKHKVKAELYEHGINHVTVETESSKEHCNEESCIIKTSSSE